MREGWEDESLPVRVGHHTHLLNPYSDHNLVINLDQKYISLIKMVSHTTNLYVTNSLPKGFETFDDLLCVQKQILLIKVESSFLSSITFLGNLIYHYQFIQYYT